MFNKIFKKICVAATAFALAVTSIPMSFGAIEVNAASDVTVNLNSEKQTMQGIGGMNHPVWISDLTSAQVNTVFGNDANQLGFNILRIHVDENKSNWSKELATAKAAAAKGALIFASPWNPPSNMCEQSSNGKRLKYSSYAAYAQHLNDFVSYMKQNGVNLYAISIQNEPDYAHEWTAWTPTEICNFMKNYAGKINCKVMAPESFQYLKNMSDPILNDPAALANMDILGTHFYGTQTRNMSYPLFKQKGAGKELWMTEVYVPDSTSSADAWPNALKVATNMTDAFAVGDFQAYVWWYIRRSYGPLKENGQISKRGYCMAQFSKFVRRGYKRVDATYNPNTNVFVSAFKGDGKAVIVAVNDSDTAYTQRFNVQGGSVKSVDRYRTSSSENLAKTANLECSSNGFYAQLPARSVSTFVCNLGSGSAVQPTQAPTQQPTQAPTQAPESGTVNTASTMQCEDMTLSGTYAGKISNPFSGVVFYANKDTASYTQQFGYDSHDFTLRGCSNNNNTAAVDLIIGGEKKGTFYFRGTTPTDVTLKNIKHVTGNVKIELTVTTDDNTWDVYCDYLKIGSATQEQTQAPTAAPTAVPTQAPTQEPQQPAVTGNIADGWYYIKAVGAQKYLQVANSSAQAGANVVISSGNGNDGQIWKVTNTNDGYITLTSKLGNFMLDVASGSAEDGANIGIYNAYSGDAQKFVAKEVGNGIYTINTKSSNSQKVLDVEARKTTDGANVCQYRSNGQTNQQWQFELVSGQVEQPTQQPTAAPTQAPTVAPTKEPATQVPQTGSKLDVTYSVNSWGSGYQVSFKISNKGTAAVNNWTLKVKKSDCNFETAWNVTLKESGEYYVITPVSWNASIPAGGSVEFGALGSGSIGTTITCSVQ